jgi:hypothetical protein
MAIIALLVSILMPVLKGAKEQARRAACAVNLRNWGTTCHQHANVHNALFPYALMLHENAYCLPSYIDTDSDPHDDRDGPFNKHARLLWYPVRKGYPKSVWYRWKRGGTPWSTFLDFGLTDQGGLCPSADLSIGNPRWDAEKNTYVDKYYNQTSSWGHRVQTCYMYMGSIQRTLGPLNSSWWGDAAPAQTSEDTDLHDRVLAADEVLVQWDHTSYINHRSQKWFESPSFQNVLHGDGHVVAATYAEDVNVRANYAFRHQSPGNTWFGASYWPH